MASGRETRAQIDTETVRGLLLINGGGAVALLAFLPGVLQKPDYESLARAIIFAVFTFQAGLAFPVIHNRLRRLCSFQYSRKKEKRKTAKFFGRVEPTICHWSVACLWTSVILFIVGGLIVLVAGLDVVGIKPDGNTTLGATSF